MRCRPNFARPFLLACGTRNPKYAGSGIICLQRLIVSKALPDELLEGVLEALRECSSLALDIQLKILQALPSLLQNYANKLKGKLLVNAFQLCFLLHNNKTAVISNTAAAALQQLVASTFEKVAVKDGLPPDDEISTEISADEGTILVRESALDAYKLLNDICLLTEGQIPQILSTATLSQNFGLELLGSILSEYADTLIIHPEQIHVCRTRLMPLIIRILSERATFSTTVRAMRLIQLILSHLLFALASECEMALSLLNHMLDPDAAFLWKRALCLEVFRGIHSDSTLARSIYSHFDEQEEKRNIMRDHLATLVRLASEKPAIIGLGNQSTVPAVNSHAKDNSGEQAAIQAEGLIGGIGAAVSLIEPDAPGISTLWSTMRVPCIDQLDKSDPPTLPPAYIYGLTLTCINNFSEGLAKFLLPFTIPIETKAKRKSRAAQKADEVSETSPEDLNKTENGRRDISRSQSSRNRRLPVNPLSLQGHVLYSQICTSGHMVEHCWPALLAACSTFLNATLDSDYYHALIRSFQRFTQVAGLLDLSTPRDAFLTTLGKHSLPSGGISSLTAGNAKNSPISNSIEHTDNQTDSERDSSPSPSISSVRKRQSVDSGTVTMNTRNLLCLRALLNLGIALGPVLQKSWLIILETLQQADLLLSHAESGRRQASGHSKQGSGSQSATDDTNGASDFGLEVAAVKTAGTRLFESTGDLSDPAFISVLTCLCDLLRITQNESQEASERLNDDLLSPKPSSRKHHRLPSLSRLSLDGNMAVRGNMFVLTRLNEIITHNILRLLRQDTVETGWDLLVEVLTHSLSQQGSGSEVRIKAASVLNDMFFAIATSQNDLSSVERDKIRKKGLIALLRGIASLYDEQRLDSKASQTCDLEIHRLIIETLRSVLEQFGDSLILGWDTVFAIITSIFDKLVSLDEITYDEQSSYASRSPKLLRSSFGPLQLICSDFISSVPHSCLLTLLETLYAFCSQQQDLNISLTTITFFRNVSDFLQREDASMEFDPSITRCRSEVDLIHVIQLEDQIKSFPALWLCLLLRLMRIANDSRLEVRHSALHTLFRIFDACGEQLSPPAWQMCYRVIVMEMLSANKAHYEAVEGSQPSHEGDENQASWNETAVIIMGGVSKLLTQNLDTMISSANFTDMWNQLLGYVQGLLERKVLDISTAVFTGMTKMLADIENIDKIGQSSMAKVWSLWENGVPVSHTDPSQGKSGNQDSIVAYLDWFHQLSRLAAGGMSLGRVKIITERLRSCVVDSDASAYSADIDKMTAVQKYSLESLRLIPTSIPGALSELIDSISGFVVLAYEEGGGKKDQTFVALSKASMDLLLSCIIDHVSAGQIQDPELLSKAISALEIPLQLKYEWQKEGKEPSPWKKATMTALVILETAIPVLKSVPDAPAFWNSIVKLSSGITSANIRSCNAPSNILEDEAFDIAAYERIQRLITPVLGLPSIPESARRAYVASLFTNSIVHTPHPDDLARPGQDLLQGLQSSHIGRTQDLPPTPRAKLSYLLLDELFHLVSVREGTPEQLRLAQAAAPFLILRAGITLKAYILDQPLRGRMPQPWSQKQELLYVLRKLVDLESEPGAIPDAPGIISQRKKHLHRLFSLVVQATAVAEGEEVSGALKTFLDVVGRDFGI